MKESVLYNLSYKLSLVVLDKDFIHKLKLASKEANETSYWLNVIKDKEYLSIEEKLFDDIISIQKIISKSKVLQNET